MIKYVDAYTLETMVEDTSCNTLCVTVLPKCPDHECNGHGTCDISTDGVCDCATGWKLEEDCSKEEGEVKLVVADGSTKVVLPPFALGFKVSVDRPVGHYMSGDFIGLFPKGGPFTSNERAT